MAAPNPNNSTRADTQRFKTEVEYKEFPAIWEIANVRENWHVILNRARANKNYSLLKVDINGELAFFSFDFSCVVDEEHNMPYDFMFYFQPTTVPPNIKEIYGKLHVEFLDKDGAVWDSFHHGPADWMKVPMEVPPQFTELSITGRRLLSDQVLGERDSLTIRYTFTLTTTRTVVYPNAAALHEKASAPLKEALARDLEQIMEDPQEADVKFSMNDGTIIPAHKLILSRRSPVFKRMFEGDFVENQGLVQITDLSSTTMKILLHFVYTAEAHPDWRTNISEVLNGANRYDLPGLFNYCDEMLVTLCDEVNPEDLLEIARLHSLSHATAEIEKFIRGTI